MRPSESLLHRCRDGWIVRYGFAVIVVALATVLRLVLQPIIPTGFPFLTFFLAVMLAAWHGGLGPGLLASVLSTLAADLLLIEPIYEFHLTAGYYWVSLGVFVVETISISLIAERMKRIQNTLHESERRFRTLADSAPVLIWMNDKEGARFVNRAYLEFVGVNDQVEVAKYDWTAFVYPKDRHRYLQAYFSAFEKGALFDEQFRFRRHDGLYRWMRSVGQPRFATDGELLGYVGATYDITEIKEAQERLERSSMELERAVNAKTTELQQSQERLRALASELNLTEQRERKRLATELHDHLQQMLVLGKLTIGQGKRSASGVPAFESVLKKVDDILSDALIYSRTLVAELSPPVLRDQGLAASLKWLAEYMKTKHEQTVTVVVPDDQELNPPEDQRVLLFQSVRELLINSAKHAGTGRAKLTMEKHADYVCITVSDDGKGFDLADAGFGTVSGGISSKFGLFSIQERMRALGGSFEIQSAPGKGTCAILVLPLTAPTDRSTIRILIADDHVMIRQGLRSMLEAYKDIQISGEAANGDEAITLAQQIQPDIVLMDINMPQRNGIDATAVIKRHFPNMVIVGLSVNAERRNREAMLQAGAATLLTKEAPVEELYQAIQQALTASSPTSHSQG
jgi:PAS domain S-box-containing protein